MAQKGFHVTGPCAEGPTSPHLLSWGNAPFSILNLNRKKSDVLRCWAWGRKGNVIGRLSDDWRPSGGVRGCPPAFVWLLDKQGLGRWPRVLCCCFPQQMFHVRNLILSSSKS